MKHKLTNFLAPLILVGGFISLIPMEQTNVARVVEYETRFEAVIPKKTRVERQETEYNKNF